jgi:hypothetical protein
LDYKIKRNISHKSKERQRPPFVFEHTCVKSLMGDVKRKKEKKKRKEMTFHGKSCQRRQRWQS